MKKLPALIAFVIIFSCCVAHAVQKSKFDVRRLSEKGRAAYQELFSANIFRLGAVGYAGETSDEELALNDLLDESNAIEALKSLVVDGSYEGGLYGLLGLRIINMMQFNHALEAYKSRGRPPERRIMLGVYSVEVVPRGKTLTQDGCLIEESDWLGIVDKIQSGFYK